MRKQEIRKKMLGIRRLQPKETRRKLSLMIWKRLKSLDEFSGAESVLFYLSLPDEVDTEKMIKESIRIGKKVLVPVTDTGKRTIKPSWLKNYEKELEPGPYGILEPKSECRRIAGNEEVKLVIVPGIAFDRSGARLGFGAGFYDRFLKEFGYGASVGLAFDFQITHRLPRGPHDVPMDIIVTPNRVITCGKKEKTR